MWKTIGKFVFFTLGGMAVRSFYNWLTEDVPPHPESKEFRKELLETKTRYRKLTQIRRNYEQTKKSSL